MFMTRQCAWALELKIEVAQEKTNPQIGGCSSMHQESPTLSLDQLETVSPRQIAVLRRKYIEKYGTGLAAGGVVPLLRDAVAAVLDAAKDTQQQEHVHLHLHRVLVCYFRLLRSDPALAEELTREETSHQSLKKLMQYQMKHSEDENTSCWSDVCFEIAAAQRKFPATTLPFTKAELEARLPLIFHVAACDGDDISTAIRIPQVLVSQVTQQRQSEQKDVGFVMWPSAVVLSRWIVTNPDRVRNKSVLELGAGCGLTGLVAALVQQQQSQAITPGSVTLTDFNPVVLENLKHNVALNGLSADTAQVTSLDFYQQIPSDDNDDETSTAKMHDGWFDMDEQQHPRVDVVVAADIICQLSDATAAAHTLNKVLLPDGLAYVVCADAAHRFGVECFVSECEKVGSDKGGGGLEIVSAINVRDLSDGKLIDDLLLEQTTGYVDGMSLTMFTIRKR